MNKYYVFSLGKVYGPYPTYDLAHNAGKSKTRAEIWTQGMYDRYVRDGKIHNMR